MRGVTVLGASGSIGVSTLDVLARHRDRYRVVALSGNTDVGASQRSMPRASPSIRRDGRRRRG